MKFGNLQKWTILALIYLITSDPVADVDNIKLTNDTIPTVDSSINDTLKNTTDETLNKTVNESTEINNNTKVEEPAEQTNKTNSENIVSNTTEAEIKKEINEVLNSTVKGEENISNLSDTLTNSTEAKSEEQNKKEEKIEEQKQPEVLSEPPVRSEVPVLDTPSPPPSTPIVERNIDEAIPEFNLTAEMERLYAETSNQTVKSENYNYDPESDVLQDAEPAGQQNTEEHPPISEEYTLRKEWEEQVANFTAAEILTVNLKAKTYRVNYFDY